MWDAMPRGRGVHECETGEGHVELITYLQLLVGHGGQSRHVVREVAGVAHVHLGIRRLVVGPHGQTLRNRGQRGDTGMRQRSGIRKSV